MDCNVAPMTTRTFLENCTAFREALADHRGGAIFTKLLPSPLANMGSPTNTS
jgi:hypothetical protein